MSVRLEFHNRRLAANPENDNIYIGPEACEVCNSRGEWKLLVTINGVDRTITPEFAERIADELEGAPRSKPVVDALQFAAYRCRMFKGGVVV